MEILYAIAIAASIGTVARYVLPGRETYGVALVPGIAGGVAAIVWAALAWFGWDWSVGAIWGLSIGAATVTAVLVILLAPRVRRRIDATFLEHARRGA